MYWIKYNYTERDVLMCVLGELNRSITIYNKQAYEKVLLGSFISIQSIHIVSNLN